MTLPMPSDGVAVVTGATSGIGAALTRQLAARGYDLLLVARDAARLEAAAASANDRYGVDATPHPVDLADTEARAELVHRLGGTDVAILCNNAGSGSFGNLAALDPRRLSEHVDVNVVAAHALCLAVIPGMVARRRGGVLMIGSTAGNQPVPGSATYAATKAFVNSLAGSLHAELSGDGVTVTLLAPGPVQTEFAARAGVQDQAERLPAPLWVDADEAAAAGLRALERGRRRAVPGYSSRLLDASGRVLPSAITALILRRLVHRSTSARR